MTRLLAATLVMVVTATALGQDASQGPPPIDGTWKMTNMDGTQINGKDVQIDFTPSGFPGVYFWQGYVMQGGERVPIGPECGFAVEILPGYYGWKNTTKGSGGTITWNDKDKCYESKSDTGKERRMTR